jgi:hypothetical protein
MASVVDIIQSAMPSTDCGGEGDEVEIPMDELDTYTLRQLQDFVHSVQQQTISIKRKRQSMTSTTSRTPRGKKAKSSSSSSVKQESHYDDVDIPDPSDMNSGSLDDDFPVHGRKRSNSLDLFPSDDMEQDPIVTSADSTKAFEEWTMSTNGSNNDLEYSDVSNNAGGTWRDAVSERKDVLHRESELRAENDKLLQHRVKVENERNDALQRAYEEQTNQSTCDEQNRAADLLVQRETERSKRAEMSQTVEFDDSHDALYQESLDL